MVVIIAVVVMITHCYYRYTASGNPVKSARRLVDRAFLAECSVVVVVLLAELALYVDPNFNLTGSRGASIVTRKNRRVREACMWRVLSCCWWAHWCSAMVYKQFRGEFRRRQNSYSRLPGWSWL